LNRTYDRPQNRQLRPATRPPCPVSIGRDEPARVPKRQRKYPIKSVLKEQDRNGT